MKRIISEAEIPEVVRNLKRGEFVALVFTKADGTRRKALAQFGVSHPTHTAEPNGTGESRWEALAAGRVKFFDASVQNADGTRGGYRQALFARILTITAAGVTYIVDHASTVTA